ncbi:MAG: protein-tyrosine phosphatase/nicotinamidase-related amidase [Chlamydiales bacterium]|jgi:protein-tyrosine phosphatase/nicotinamidase-related amidase
MTPSLLLTQCLQNDFVKPVGRFEPLPNRLHVGYSEALRLMGANPAEGPVARVMRWAHQCPDAELRLIHVRDWHDPLEKVVQDHFHVFGEHCVQGTAGAEFAFSASEDGGKDVVLVDSLTLNDFQGTGLAETLAPYADQACRIGIAGVWTEAKVSFLAYEIVTRYPQFQVAVCSALTASSSRQHHFEALDQLRRILGVRVIDSVGEFVEFLGGSADADAPLVGLQNEYPSIELVGLELTDTDRTLVRYLFRDCRSVKLKALAGGFSGNVVAGSTSYDMHGHEQVPHVVKIGEQEEMGKERASFERVQDVLGNAAPQITDFADTANRGAIKYRYASMGGTFSSTFQKAYEKGMPMPEVKEVLDTLFGEQLMRFYKAATLESVDLLEYYFFSDKWAGSVRDNVESIHGGPATGDTIEILPGLEAPNVCRFYDETLHGLPRRPADQIQQSWMHGDLNGANIILDGHRNVWLIDFFHTKRGHVLQDFVKLENDLLYIWTPVEDEDDLRNACAFTDALLEVEDLAAPLPDAPSDWRPQFRRTWETVQHIRGYYPQLVQSGRDPFQLLVAQMRYSVHNLCFEESTPLQLKWALYTSGHLSHRIADTLTRSVRLRLDWMDEEWTTPGRVGLTILPGRRDWGRSLADDVATLKEEGVSRLLCLVPQEELHLYGVDELLPICRAAGMLVHHLPIVDQKACSQAEMIEALGWVDEGLRNCEKVAIHCVGGIGRSGMAAAAYLRTRGAAADEAMESVRAARSQRALETTIQEQFIRDFPADSLS